MSDIKKTTLNILLYGLAILIIYSFIHNVLEVDALKDNIRQVQPVYLMHLTLLTTVIIAMRAYLANLALKAFGINLTPKEWLGLGAVNSLMQYILPMRSGTLVKAYYLKKVHGFKISESASIMIYSNFICYQVVFLVSILLFTNLGSFTDTEFPYLNYTIALFGLLFLAGLVFMLVLNKVRLPKGDGRLGIRSRILNILHLFVEGMKSINSNIPLLILITGSYFVIVSLEALRFFYVFKAIGLELSALKIMVITAVNYMGVIVMITPGQLGIQEMIISFTSKLIGLTFENGFVAAGLLRAVIIFINIALGAYFAYTINILKAFKVDDVK